MKKVTLSEIIEKMAANALEKQLTNGSMPPGHNGPYHDPETPVRNTAHWLFTFSALYEKTGEQKWAKAAHKAADYLCSKEARPMDASFWCRKNPQKDFCNGVMGQAWAMEGLIKAAEALQREDCYKMAEEVFLLHPFDEDKSIWQRVNVDGSYASYDGTFNHQLWFAAVASNLSKTPVAEERAIRFLDIVEKKIDLYKDGVLTHNSPVAWSNKITTPFSMMKKFYDLYNRRKSKKLLYLKSVGYHAFNLYAFAILKKQFPDHSFFSDLRMKKMLSVLGSRSFFESMNDSPYGYWYNPPGLEIAFSLEILGDSIELAQKWIDLQASKTFNHETESLLSKGAPDPVTADARIYEAFRLLSDYSVSL